MDVQDAVSLPARLNCACANLRSLSSPPPFAVVNRVHRAVPPPSGQGNYVSSLAFPIYWMDLILLANIFDIYINKTTFLLSIHPKTCVQTWPKSLKAIY